jgi:hypothetical protein
MGSRSLVCVTMEVKFICGFTFEVNNCTSNFAVSARIHQYLLLCLMFRWGRRTQLQVLLSYENLSFRIIRPRA